ncbi:MAG: hypothetical protein SGILL_009400 [Bacillariaceae sp.]
MSSTIVPPPNGKVNFSGIVGAKRRRMRSGGNVSTLNNNSPLKNDAGGALVIEEGDTEKTAQTSKCKGATTIPIFLKKTYKMIESCPPDIASWTPDGEMFVVKDPDRFASQIIPQVCCVGVRRDVLSPCLPLISPLNLSTPNNSYLQYFDHNKFSSFARQLNFYGFRKMQSKPIRNSDFDANTAKHVTFFNENFKRGRCDLLKKIQRSTRGGGTGSGLDQAKEVQDLKEKVGNLEQTIKDMHTQHEERMRRLELDMLGRMEQMMMAIQQQQQSNNSTGAATVTSDSNAMKPPVPPGTAITNGVSNTFDPLPFGVGGARGQSLGSLGGLASLMGSHQASLGFKNNLTGAAGGAGGPTLPPHPKMKQLPTQNLPGSLTLPTGRLDSLRGISALSRGLSNLSRGLSTESQGSAMLGGAFEDKFFSMLMNGNDAANKAAAAGAGNNFMNPTPIQNQLNAANLARLNSAANTATAAAGNTTGI